MSGKKFTNDEEKREEPFDAGFIYGIFMKRSTKKRSKDVILKVKKLYRPHNTHLFRSAADQEDFNKLYWSDEGEWYVSRHTNCCDRSSRIFFLSSSLECTLRFNHVEGQCFVAYEQNSKTSAEEWSEGGPYCSRKRTTERTNASLSLLALQPISAIVINIARTQMSIPIGQLSNL